jgi:hypothetical protein
MMISAAAVPDLGKHICAMCPEYLQQHILWLKQVGYLGYLCWQMYLRG